MSDKHKKILFIIGTLQVINSIFLMFMIITNLNEQPKGEFLFKILFPFQTFVLIPLFIFLIIFPIKKRIKKE